jgi:hypothetical protein
MSKGHGKVERAILEALRWDRLSAHQGRFSMGADAKTLAVYVRGERDGHPSPTRSELESVRRALRNLRKQGLILPPTKYRHVIYMTPGKRPRSG